MLDAALRKKLDFETLPEPAVHQTSGMRTAWTSGKFVSQLNKTPANVQSEDYVLRIHSKIVVNSLYKSILDIFYKGRLPHTVTDRVLVSKTPLNVL